MAQMSLRNLLVDMEKHLQDKKERGVEMKRFVFLPISLFLFLMLCFSFFARAESIKPTGSVCVLGTYTDVDDRVDNDKMSARGEYEE